MLEHRLAANKVCSCVILEIEPVHFHGKEKVYGSIP